MKLLILTLFLSISFFSQAQNDSIKLITDIQSDYKANLRFTPINYRQERVNKWATIGVYLGSITLGAVGDGLNDRGNKSAGHLCNALSIGILISSPFYIDYKQGRWYQYLLSYAWLRLATFDPIYNRTRNLPFNYLDNITPTDRILSYFGGPQYIRFVSLVVGVSVPLNF
jgi:hypothetical protein